jgi:SAM-dependent methyltransferase
MLVRIRISFFRVPPTMDDLSMIKKTMTWLIRSLTRLSMIGMKKNGVHIVRYWPNQHFHGILNDGNEGRGKKTLAISKSGAFCRMIGLGQSEILETTFPDVDMLKLPYPDETFDYVVSEYVIEHVAGDVQHAIHECRRVLKPGGTVVHLTNFIYPIHGSPHDYWRFTPYALQLLHRDFSEIIETGGWGNHYVILLRVLDLFFTDVPECRFHPLNAIARRNDPDFPLVTWIIAKK